jgi:hypothetical protein
MAKYGQYAVELNSERPHPPNEKERVAASDRVAQELGADISQIHRIKVPKSASAGDSNPQPLD